MGLIPQQWYNCVLPTPPRPPYPAPLRMTLDPAYFANDTSDHSAFCVGYQHPEDNIVTLLDCDSDRWKGIELPKRIVAAIKEWKPEQLWIERSGNGAPDLLADNIIQMCGANVPVISFYTPKQSKATRISKLQAVIDGNYLKINPIARMNALMEQVRNFDFTDKQNHRHEDGRLDALAALVGFRN
jgi:predicted phage terminase large subunit-like protein